MSVKAPCHVVGVIQWQVKTFCSIKGKQDFRQFVDKEIHGRPQSPTPMKIILYVKYLVSKCDMFGWVFRYHFLLNTLMSCGKVGFPEGRCLLVNGFGFVDLPINQWDVGIVKKCKSGC